MKTSIPVWESFKYREVFIVTERDSDGAIKRTRTTGKFVRVDSGFEQSNLILASVSTPATGFINLDVITMAEAEALS